MTWDHQREIETICKNLNGTSFQDQKILITGGAGFLGSWMCDTLVGQGAYVTCVDNLSSGLRSNISHLEGRDNFQFVEHDASEPFDLDEDLDLVMHMASRASPFEFEQYPIEILKANTLGLMVSLELARRSKARVLYTSTSEVYGNPAVVPTPESYYGNVNSVGPRGCYDEAKRCGEAYAMAYNRQHGLDVRIARIFNTYGPRMRSDGIYGRAIPRFISQAIEGKPLTVFGDGTQTRSFTFVTDQIEGLLRLAAIEDASERVVNIGNNQETTVIDMAKLVLKVSGSSSKIEHYPLPPDDPLRRRPDITRATERLSWRPKVDLAEGLQRTIEWFRSSGL
jgi:UDP-glucuronate decarboxylase